MIIVDFKPVNRYSVLIRLKKLFDLYQKGH